MRPKVSVITVCYNSAATIRKTIESVLRQSYCDIEYIIVDGASVDGTLSIVEEYRPLFGERMKLVSEPDKGIYDAMNKGIHMTTGTLIGILNSDDFYEPMAVEHMINAMTDEKYQILYGFVRFLKNGVECSIDRKSHKFLRQEMIGHSACFVTKAVYDDFGCFDLQYISVADYDFMLRMDRIEAVKFYPVDYLITNFTIGGMSASAAAWLDLLKLRRNYGMISEKEYKKELFKDKVYKVYR
ncbi:MAG: glycosyltransferase, partial [Lachnospiraceae bacterium]|nr:glycosyltransferase [Lachnospiraceae bacterium]